MGKIGIDNNMILVDEFIKKNSIDKVKKVMGYNKN